MTYKSFKDKVILITPFEFKTKDGGLLAIKRTIKIPGTFNPNGSFYGRIEIGKTKIPFYCDLNKSITDELEEAYAFFLIRSKNDEFVRADLLNTFQLTPKYMLDKIKRDS